MGAMWLERGTPALITVLLTAVSLAGCAGSSISSNSLGSNAQLAGDRGCATAGERAHEMTIGWRRLRASTAVVGA